MSASRDASADPAAETLREGPFAKCWNCGRRGCLTAICHFCAVIAKTQDEALNRRAPQPVPDVAAT